MDPTAAPAPARRAEHALRVRGSDLGTQARFFGGAAARDRALVRWIGSLGAATLDQLRERFGIGRTVAYRRVAACVEAGLLERVHLLHGQPAFIRATSRGLRYANLALPVARLSPELAEHWLVCGWVAVRLVLAPDETLLSERELRLRERLEGRPLASVAIGELPSGGPRLHRPDLVVVGHERVTAIEVELTPKSPRRLEGILKGWRRARCVDSVRYYAAAGTTRRGVERAVERLRAEERVEVRALEDLL